MNIDDLKSTWQALHQKEEAILQSEQIKQLLKGKAKGSIYKIKRSIILEASATLLLTLLFAFKKEWFYAPYSYEYVLGIGFVCVMWYIFKYWRISTVDLQNDLRNSLRSLVNALAMYLKVYFYGGLLVCLLASLLPLVWSNHNTDTFIHGGVWIALVVVAVTFPIYYLFLKWYLKKVYGNYVQELRNELKELEDIEE